MTLQVTLSVKFRFMGITFGTVAPPTWNFPLGPIQIPLPSTKLISFNERGVSLTVVLV